jgi:hypothetical protein
MEKYKGISIPPVNHNMENVQQRLCEDSAKCVEFCENCLFDPSNLPEFTAWYYKNKPEAEIRQQIKDIYKKLESITDADLVKRWGLTVLDLEEAIKGSVKIPVKMVIHFKAWGENNIWELDGFGKVLKTSPVDEKWLDFQLVNTDLKKGDMPKIRIINGKTNANLTLGCQVTKVEHKEEVHNG